MEISNDKLEQVHARVYQNIPGVSLGQVRDFVLADWREPEHQDWLDSSSASDIADWVIAGIR